MKHLTPWVWRNFPYIFLYSILLSSTVSIIENTSLALYHISSVFFAVIFIRRVGEGIVSNKYFLFYILYISLLFVFELLFANSNSIIAFLIRFINFTTSFFMMVLLVSYFRVRRDKLDNFVKHFVIVVTLFGMYQLIARAFDLPFGILEHNRFRDFGNISQLTSFFREPRYYGMFIGIFLYIVLFSYKGRHRMTLALLLILSGLLTQSVTAYIFLTSVILLYLFRSFGLRNMATSLLVVSIFASILLQFENFTNRLDLVLNTDFAGVFQYLQYENIGQDFNKSGNLFGGSCAVNAGCVTIFGELGYLLQVLTHSPLFGYGINYSFGDIYRTMALNGITEIVLRWGLLGLAMFFAFILRKRKNKARLFAVVLVYVASFGNIGQPLFWFLLSLIYIIHSESLSCEKDTRSSND